MTTAPMVTTDSPAGFDLLLIPTHGLVISGPHMSAEDTDAARTAWRTDGGCTAVPGQPGWIIAVCNARDGVGRIRQMVRIPRRSHQN